MNQVNDKINHSQQQQQHIDLFNLNEDNNSQQQKYCYYYETNDQQQHYNSTTTNNNNNNEVFFTSTSGTTTTNSSNDNNCVNGDDEYSYSTEMLNKLVIKYEWLKLKTNVLLLNDDFKTINNQQQQQQQQHEENFDCIILNCSYCSIYYNCDKFLIQKFEQFLQGNAENIISNIHYLLNKFLSEHEQTNEHKIACASTYLTSSTTDSLSSSSSSSSMTMSTNNHHQQLQQADSTIMITNLDSTPHTLTPQSSPQSTSISFNDNQQAYLLINKSPPVDTSSKSSSKSSCFKDEEIESCLNTHELVVNENFILESLTNSEPPNYYNTPPHLSHMQQQQQQQKNCKKNPTKHSNQINSSSSGDVQQYGSILKAINKRKLHISCPLCVSRVVNMSDHLVKKHSIKDRYQRKHLMDSVRRNYLANTNSTTVALEASASNLNEFNLQNKRNSLNSSNNNNQLMRNNSTPNKTRKLIKCPICSDDNKFFVNISDHLIKIHHLNTSEQRKPYLKTIKSWNKSSNNLFINNSQQKRSSNNNPAFSNNASFAMLVDEQQQQQSVEVDKISEVAATNPVTDEILIINSHSSNNTSNNDENEDVDNDDDDDDDDDDEMNEDGTDDNDDEDGEANNSTDYLLNLNERFEEEAHQQKQQEQVIVIEQEEHANDVDIDVYLNHRFQSIKKNDLRKSILKRYSKQIRKNKTNNHNYLNSRSSKKIMLDNSNGETQIKTVNSGNQQHTYNLLKLENNVNSMNSQINNIMEMHEAHEQQVSNNNSNTGSEQYYSNSSIMINQQNNSIFDDRSKENQNELFSKNNQVNIYLKLVF